MADFFVSYNQADEAKAEWIAHALREAKFSVRFAKWELGEGGSIAGWMREAIEDSDRLIAVCSPDYFDPKAGYSEIERQAFLWASPKRFGGTILPVVVRAVAIPKIYAHFLRVDLTGVEEAEAKARLLGVVSASPAPHAPPVFAAEPAAPSFQPAPSGAPVAAAPANRSFFGWPGLIALSALLYALWADHRADGLVLRDLGAALTSAWLPILLLALYGGVAWMINAGLDAPDSRRAIAAALRLDRGGALYRSAMGRALDWIDARFSTEEIDWLLARRGRGGADGRGAPTAVAEHWTVAWSPRLFEGCLFIAIFYPLYSVFAIWAATNAPGTVGEFEIVPGGQELWVRVSTIGGLVGALGFGQLAKRRRAQGRVAEAHLFLALAAAVAAAVAFFATAVAAVAAFAAAAAAVAVAALATATAAAVAAVFATATATAAVAVAFAVVAAFAVAVVAAVLALFFGRRRSGQWARRSWGEFITAALAAAITAETTRYAGFHENELLALGLPAILGVFFWIVKVAGEALEAAPRRYGRRGVFYGVYAAALAGGFAALVSFGDLRGADGTFFLFLGFLPLLNAVFDFASLGLTRFCLRRGLRPGFLVSLRWSLVDALAAAALFAGLVVSVILTVYWVRDGGGRPLIDLNAVFKGIAADPNRYWWLYLSFFSTLIPTLLHLGIACFSFVALAPAPLQRMIAGWIGEMDRNGFANLGARAALPLIVTLSIAMPFLGLYGIGLWLAEYHDALGWGFFRLALGFAEWLDPAYVTGVEEILAGRGA